MTAHPARRLLRHYRALYHAGGGLSVDDVRRVMRAALLLLPSKTLMPFPRYISPWQGDVRYCPKGLLAAVLGLTQVARVGVPIANYGRLTFTMSGEALALMNSLEQIAMSAARDAGDGGHCNDRPSRAAYDAVVAALG